MRPLLFLYAFCAAAGTLCSQTVNPADKDEAELRRLVAESREKGLLFGLDDPTGMIGVYSLERETVPDSLNKADVQGRLVFPSPDGLYAISHPTTEQAEKTQYEVENHLVSLKTMKALIPIPNLNGGDFERRNHGGIRALWRADSRAALLICEGKWEPSTFCALVIDAEGKARALDLMSPVHDAIIAEMRRRWPEIHKKLKLAAEDVFHDEEVPWNLEYLQYGAEFTPDGKGVRVIASFETNGKRIEGQMVARAKAEGVFSLLDDSFKLTSAHVSDAGVVTYTEGGEEVLKPKVVFPKVQKKKP